MQAHFNPIIAADTPALRVSLATTDVHMHIILVVHREPQTNFSKKWEDTAHNSAELREQVRAILWYIPAKSGMVWSYRMLQHVGNTLQLDSDFISAVSKSLKQTYSRHDKEVRFEQRHMEGSHGHFFSMMVFPLSSYSCLETHICWKVP